MFNQQEYQTVILAALLHDIGKFLQWGSLAKPGDFEKHPKVSEKFVSDFSECFEKVADLQLLRTLVQRHHNSADFLPELRLQDIQDSHVRSLAHLVNKADSLSSAEYGRSPNQSHEHKIAPLNSIFGRVTLDNNIQAKTLRHHLVALEKVDSLGAIFPGEFADYASNEAESHLKAFDKDFRLLVSRLDTNNFDCVFTHLLGILQKYTWCIPSNPHEEIADVSLFDHLKTTAAISAALYQYHAYGNTLDEQHIKTSAERFRIVVGDISGIQNYIFDIASTGVAGVARRLRARSLYIQLISEVVPHKILRGMNLPFANIIMSSGGKFYLLLPNTNQAEGIVQSIQKEADDWLLEKLNGELAINLGTTTCSDDGFSAATNKEGGFGKVLQDANMALNLRKQRRFTETLIDKGMWKESSFLLKGFEGENVCHSCHKFPQSAGELCANCDLDLQVGRILPRARYLSFFSEKAKGAQIPILGYSVAVTSEIQSSDVPYLVLKINDTNIDDLAMYPALPKYLANHIPRAEMFNCGECKISSTCIDKPNNAQEPAKFDCLANSAKGRPLLGFLKADVDNLGATFIYGLKRDSGQVSYDTVSRLSTLSRQLDTFFTGWVEHLMGSDFTRCYVVFSGGDDLFIVGPWIETIRLADRIRDDFARYTGNPQITLSASIFMSKPRFPIARTSGAANALLDDAKISRNSVALLGHPLPWDRWKLVEKQWHELEPDINKLSSAFLYSLLHYGQMWKDWLGGDVLGLRCQPLLAFNIARNLNRRDNPAIYDWAEGLLKFNKGREDVLFTLANLELIATLLILSKEGGGR